MGIHINHLSLFVVGGGDIFISDIPIFRKSIECRIEVLCGRKKIASASVVEIGFQALFYILCLENPDYLLSLDNVPVGSIHAETVNRLIAVVVGDAERPQKRIMIHTFLGRLDTPGTAVRTMKNTGYPKYQPVKLTAPVLTAAHGLFYFLLDIVITVFDILLGSVTGQVQYRFLTAQSFFPFRS